MLGTHGRRNILQTVHAGCHLSSTHRLIAVCGTGSIVGSVISVVTTIAGEFRHPDEWTEAGMVILDPYYFRLFGFLYFLGSFGMAMGFYGLLRLPDFQGRRTATIGLWMGGVGAGALSVAGFSQLFLSMLSYKIYEGGSLLLILGVLLSGVGIALVPKKKWRWLGASLSLWFPVEIGLWLLTFTAIFSTFYGLWAMIGLVLVLESMQRPEPLCTEPNY
jgi:hypothetical protein